MKSYGGQFNRAVTVENIERCIFTAAKGKRYKRSVQYALANSEKVANGLYRDLMSGKWHPPKVHKGRVINDGVNLKKRVIVCPEFVREQVVHHVIVGELEKIFLPNFFRWSCGSVPGRGQEEMARHFKRKFDPKKFRYVAKVDIAKCFDSIDKDALYDLLKKKIRDKKFLALVRKVVYFNKVEQPDSSVKDNGTPIGLFTSPWFANIVLSKLDHILKDKHGMTFVLRFMDDIIIFHQNKRKLRNALIEAEQMASRFGLRFKDKISIHPFGGKSGMKVIRFCGMRFHSNGKVSLRDRIYIRGVRCGRRIRRTISRRQRVTAYNASRLITYAARFKAFGTYRGFMKNVTCGVLKVSLMREKVSTRDKLKAKGAQNVCV